MVPQHGSGQCGLGLGGAPLGNLFRAISDDDAHAVVQHALEAGIRYFDTAPHYGHGLSEHRMGAVLRTQPRDAFVLSTKVGRVLSANPDAPRSQFGYEAILPFDQHYDYTRTGVLRSLDDSLQRLGLARVDLVYVHDLDRHTHGEAFAQRFRDLLDGGLPALAELKASGAIGGYGMGVNYVDICLETLRHADLDVILLAGRYTLADQSALATLLPECMRRNVGVVAAAPFNSGILASGTQSSADAPPQFDYRPAPPEVIQRVAAIERICAAFAVPLRAAALQFPCAHPAVRSVLAGARNIREVADNLQLLRHPIPDHFWQALRDRRLIEPTAPWPHTTPPQPPAQENA
jgi:D-threo-aldose 1-dehydrogenase